MRKNLKSSTFGTVTKRVTLLIGILILLAGGICLVNKISVSAAGSSEKKLYYKSVMVEQGDSLWSIAEENMSEEWGSVKEYVQAIKKLNNKSDNQINAGAYISIPYYQ